MSGARPGSPSASSTRRPATSRGSTGWTAKPAGTGTTGNRLSLCALQTLDKHAQDDSRPGSNSTMTERFYQNFDEGPDATPAQRSRYREALAEYEQHVQLLVDLVLEATALPGSRSRPAIRTSPTSCSGPCQAACICTRLRSVNPPPAREPDDTVYADLTARVSPPPAATAPVRPPCRRPFPGADQAPTRPRRPHQRIRAGRIEAKVKTRGRVLEPHRGQLLRPMHWVPSCAAPAVGDRRGSRALDGEDDVDVVAEHQRALTGASTWRRLKLSSLRRRQPRYLESLRTAAGPGGPWNPDSPGSRTPGGRRGEDTEEVVAPGGVAQHVLCQLLNPAGELRVELG